MTTELEPGAASPLTLNASEKYHPGVVSGREGRGFRLHPRQFHAIDAAAHTDISLFTVLVIIAARSLGAFVRTTTADQCRVGRCATRLKTISNQLSRAATPSQVSQHENGPVRITKLLVQCKPAPIRHKPSTNAERAVGVSTTAATASANSPTAPRGRQSSKVREILRTDKHVLAPTSFRSSVGVSTAISTRERRRFSAQERHHISGRAGLNKSNMAFRLLALANYHADTKRYLAPDRIRKAIRWWIAKLISWVTPRFFHPYGRSHDVRSTKPAVSNPKLQHLIFRS